MVMKIHLAMLVSDWLLYALLVMGVATIVYIRKRPHWREPWRQLLYRRSAMITIVILGFYVGIGLLDSIHVEVIDHANSAYPASQVVSILDVLLNPVGQQDEKTYSQPFAMHLYSKEMVTLSSGKQQRIYPRLAYGGAHLASMAD